MDIIDNLLIVPLLAGASFILGGILMKAFPPKNVNGFYGYRTPNSMESKEKWDFAQKYSTKEMIQIGGIMILLSFLGLFLNPADDYGLYLGLALMIILIVILFIRVEKAINNKFPKDRISS